jgi:hypothetical protein
MTAFLVFGLFACTKKIDLTTVGGQKIAIKTQQCSGEWDASFDRNLLFAELTADAGDSNLMRSFQNPRQINKLDKHGRRHGIWITGEQRYFDICFYKRNQKHGKEIAYQSGNESIEWHYRKGKLHGWFSRKLDKYPFFMQYYRKGKLKKSMTISPNW